MPAKKKAGKKKAGTTDGSDMDPTQELHLLKAQMKAMERELGERRKQALRAEREKRELEARVSDLRDDFKETAEDTEAITADMTRQYKAMEERFMDDINRLEAEVMSLKDELAEERARFEELKRERDADVSSKQEEISALKKKMEEMADEFAEMLQETLQRMADKIEISATKWEGDSSVPVIQRGSEFEPSGTRLGGSSSPTGINAP